VSWQQAGADGPDTYYYFWLILQLFIRLWLVLFSEKKSWLKDGRYEVQLHCTRPMRGNPGVTSAST